MATPAQIEANRQNASKSTGPRTPEGKAKSRRNALRLGLSATALMISGEDVRENAEIAQDYYRLCPPANAVQRFHFENVVYCDWMIRRCRRIEAELMNHLMAKDRSVPFEVEAGVAFLRDAAGANALYKLHRRMASLEKSYYRSLQELEAAGARFEGEPPDPEPDPAASPQSDLAREPPSATGYSAPQPAAEALPEGPEPDLNTAPAAPAVDPASEIGFVLANSENAAPAAPKPCETPDPNSEATLSAVSSPRRRKPSHRSQP